jgi:hypothetical protein
MRKFPSEGRPASARHLWLLCSGRSCLSDHDSVSLQRIRDYFTNSGNVAGYPADDRLFVVPVQADADRYFFNERRPYHPASLRRLVAELQEEGGRTH